MFDVRRSAVYLSTMSHKNQTSLNDLDEDAALRTILEGTATATGEPFFAALVKNLSQALNTHGAWVTEYLSEERRLKALAFWLDGRLVDDYEYEITGTPCEPVIDGTRLVHIPENVVELYPQDPDLPAMGAVSYMGVPLLDLDDRTLGHLAVLDTRPMLEEPRSLALFQIFAARAAAELQRLRAEADVRNREEKLGRLVDSAMDAIIEIDRDFKVILTNPAAEKNLGEIADRIIGDSFKRFLPPEDREKLENLIVQLKPLPEGRQALWIPGGLNVKKANGEVFSAEATLSQFELERKFFYTLILRNVDDRLEAEKKIRSLKFETEYLRAEINSLRNFDEIIGNSRAMQAVSRDVDQVAETDATVLILGETGTGKELIARAIHNSSLRNDKSLITVNCAAIPANLMESEFFGHEKGAFSGATQKRSGRFAVADQGTIFLDEIGELPVDLQAKLLRVLQEGEFEPVGSSRTQKVDVRVIAATNRDLLQATADGKFREDLYYRLNVFPIKVPPLRERGDDIILLAWAFTQKFARKMGRSIDPLTDPELRRLKSYSWPGNVRELQNVIERAVITSQDGRLNLNREFPQNTPNPETDSSISPTTPSKNILTIREMLNLERSNLIAALESSKWQVSGENGAAKLLEMPPSTLSSRMKALGIKRPK
jgi:PAS domain S-box-containing protein